MLSEGNRAPGLCPYKMNQWLTDPSNKRIASLASSTLPMVTNAKPLLLSVTLSYTTCINSQRARTIQSSSWELPDRESSTLMSKQSKERFDKRGKCNKDPHWQERKKHKKMTATPKCPADKMYLQSSKQRRDNHTQRCTIGTSIRTII